MNISKKAAPLFFTLIVLLFISNKIMAGVVVINGLSHIEEVVPGGIYRGVIEIQNTSEIAQAVQLRSYDYRYNSDGETFYDEPGSHGRSNAKWVDLSPAFLTLAGKEKTTVAYEIKIPDNADLYGTYWSVVMVESVNALDDEALRKGVNINTQVRYAVQLSTTIAKKGKKNLSFTKAEIKNEDGQRFLAIDIENPSDCLLTPQVSAELFDENGQSIAILDSDKRKLYPGTSVRFYVPIKNVPNGSYQAMVLADCSDENIFGVNVSLEID